MRPLTEAEYLAWVEKHHTEFAARLNERFADVLPAGTRFEWTADAASPAPAGK